MSPRASLGEAIGRAYVASRGRGTVFAGEPDSPLLTIQIDRTGERLARRRESITWTR